MDVHNCHNLVILISYVAHHIYYYMYMYMYWQFLYFRCHFRYLLLLCKYESVRSFIPYFTTLTLFIWTHLYYLAIFTLYTYLTHDHIYPYLFFCIMIYRHLAYTFFFVFGPTIIESIHRDILLKMLFLTISVQQFILNLKQNNIYYGVLT